MTKGRFMGALSRRFRSRGSQADELGAPVDVRADGGEEDEVPASEGDAAFLQVLGKEDEHSGGRGVSVAVDVAGHAIGGRGPRGHVKIHWAAFWAGGVEALPPGPWPLPGPGHALRARGYGLWVGLP